MEKYVTSKDLAERLKAANFPQTTQWFIRVHKPTGRTKLYSKGEMDYDNERFRGNSPGNVRFREENEFFAAPLSDELLEQLQDYVKLFRNNDHEYVAGCILLNAPLEDNGHHWEKATKQSDALALLWLYCHDHNLLPKTKEQEDEKDTDAI